MNLHQHKILVTGADGFIGSHLTEALLRQGCDVRAFVYYNSLNSWGWLEALPDDLKGKLDVFSGDIRDPFGVKKAMEGCQIVLHLAALIGIPYSYHSPQSYVETNVSGTLNLLQAARELRIQKFVHTSTSEVYGTAQTIPITEDHPLHAQSPYAATKIAADQLALSFYCSFGVPVCVLRPFNTFGPRQSARAVIPTVITQIAEGMKQIRLGALTPTRDFSYVPDTVQGFIAAAESDRTVGETIHLGSGFEISIEETALLIAEIMNEKVTIVGDAERLRPQKSEVQRLLADASKAERLMGWRPEFAGRTGFCKALEETIRWFSHIENRMRYKADVCNL